MIQFYEFRTLENGEEALFLYLSLEEEFSMEWLAEFKDKTWKQFISHHHALIRGCKVFLVVGGITVAVFSSQKFLQDSFTPISDSTVYVTQQVVNPKENVTNPVEFEENESISSNEEVGVKDDTSFVENSSDVDEKKPVVGIPSDKIESTGSNPSVSGSGGSLSEEKIPDINESIKDESSSLENTFFVSVKRSNGIVEQIAMEDYLIGVVASEMPASFHEEALKVQSILARTYALKRISKGLILTDTVSTQRYIDVVEMKKMWGSQFDTYYRKIKNAVLKTDGLVMMYQGELIDALYHSTSNGMTEDSQNVWGNAYPYLVSVDSHWDKTVSSYEKTTVIDDSVVLKLFGVLPQNLDFEILRRNASGRVAQLRIGEKIYSGVEFRNLLGLRSSDFELSVENHQLLIKTKGFGHGVGVSQYGANAMAKEGRDYLSIIKHYYQNVEIRNY